MEFHLAEDATLLASMDPNDYADGLAGVLNADGAVGLRITGTGHIDGQALKFMNGYLETDQRWAKGVPAANVLAGGLQGPGGERHLLRALA